MIELAAACKQESKGDGYVVEDPFEDPDPILYDSDPIVCLDKALKRLTPDQRAELIVLAWTGRGTQGDPSPGMFAHEVERVKRQPHLSNPGYIGDKAPKLADHLTAGLRMLSKA